MKLYKVWFIIKSLDYLTTWYGITHGHRELNPLIQLWLLPVFLIGSTLIIYFIEKRYPHWAIRGMIGLIIGITALVFLVNMWVILH
jgi:hypothetical protein